MDTNLLQSYVRIADTRSFTQAADELAITPSGLSQRISRLERNLGQRLFDRTTRSVELTEVGAAILPPARAILNAEADIEEIARSANVAVSDSIKFYVMENGIGRLLIDLVGAVRSEIPRLRVEIVQVDLTDQNEAFSGAEGVSALITRRPFPESLETARSTRLAADPLCLVVPDESSVDEPVASADVLDMTPRLIPRLPEEWKSWSPLFEPSTSASSTMVIHSFRDAIQAVSVDRLACVAPLSLASSYVAADCRIVEISDAPVGSIELVSISEDPIVDRFHVFATAQGGLDAPSDVASTGGELALA